MEKQEILSNFTFFNKCLKFLDCKSVETIKTLSIYTKDLPNNPNFLKLIIFLESQGIFEVNKEKKPFKYFLNKKKLAFFLRDSPYFHEFGKIVVLTKPYDYNF